MVALCDILQDFFLPQQWGPVHDQYDLLPLLHSESRKCFAAQGGTEGSFTFLIAAPKLLGSSSQVRILAS